MNSVQIEEKASGTVKEQHPIRTGWLQRSKWRLIFWLGIVVLLVLILYSWFHLTGQISTLTELVERNNNQLIGLEQRLHALDEGQRALMNSVQELQVTVKNSLIQQAPSIAVEGTGEAATISRPIERNSQSATAQAVQRISLKTFVSIVLIVLLLFLLVYMVWKLRNIY